jgi:hypothetical protein
MKNNTTNHILFKELVDNAFDFLERAISEFETQPKYSVVHFSTALELILKARLVHEHWSLIVEGVPNIRSFTKGDFRSINFKDIIPKIEGVLSETIDKTVKDAFKKISEHRNQMVHFFHEIDNSKKKEKLNEIAIEQSLAWYHLQQLLMKWEPIFSDYNTRIDLMVYKMRNHTSYLQAVYQQILPQIENDKKSGKRYFNCDSCGLEASLQHNIHEKISEAECRICSHNMFLINMSCVACEAIIEFSNDNFPGYRCQECQEKVTIDDIKHFFNTNPATYDDTEVIVMNCALCTGSDTVVQYNNVYFCANCFHYEKEIAVCQSCHEGQLAGGKLEDSYVYGCEHCDGQGNRLTYEPE